LRDAALFSVTLAAWPEGCTCRRGAEILRKPDEAAPGRREPRGVGRRGSGAAHERTRELRPRLAL